MNGIKRLEKWRNTRVYLLLPRVANAFAMHGKTICHAWQKATLLVLTEVIALRVFVKKVVCFVAVLAEERFDACLQAG